MSSRPPRILLPVLLGTAAAAHGAGLGELTLHSRLGQPLRAEVALSLGEGEAPAGTCFSLAPVGNSDLPVVTAGQLKLVRIGGGHRLLVTGAKPLSDPLAVLALRVGCGFDLQREYVLMPQPPLLEEAPAISAGPAGASPLPSRQRRAQPESSPPSEPLPPPKRQARRESSGGDRLVLGPGPADGRLGDNSAPGGLPELEERILKLETSLHYLREEVSRLDEVLALKAESLSTQERLRSVRKPLSEEPVPAALRAGALPAPPASARPDNRANWLELIVSMVLGGSLAALGAHGLSRWREARRSDRIRDIDELALQTETR